MNLKIKYILFIWNIVFYFISKNDWSFLKTAENKIFVIHNHEVAGSCPALATKKVVPQKGWPFYFLVAHQVRVSRFYPEGRPRYSGLSLRWNQKVTNFNVCNPFSIWYFDITVYNFKFLFAFSWSLSAVPAFRRGNPK